MRPTRVPVLGAVVVVAGAAGGSGGLVVAGLDAALPRVPASAPTVLVLIAVMLLAAALGLRSRLRAQRDRRPQARGVDALTTARAAVLAKASSPVGAAVAGLYGGYAIFLSGDLSSPARREMLLTSGLAFGAALAVVAAALLLERVCRLPEDPDARADGEPGRRSERPR